MNKKIKLVFATLNINKFNEVKKIFDSALFDIIPLSNFEGTPEIIEDGLTFEENAKIKAGSIYNFLKIPVIADDSGLIVEQINGMPGVYSARYAGENATDKDNNDLLLFELMDFEKPHKAKFICSAVFFDGKNFITTDGELAGEIIDTPKGENGFGYDPVFIPEGYSKTLAELGSGEKNRISHRAIAFQKLEKEILNYYNVS